MGIMTLKHKHALSRDHVIPCHDQIWCSKGEGGSNGLSHDCHVVLRH